MYEYRCDERLKPKDEGSTRLTYTGLHQCYPQCDGLGENVVYSEAIKRELKTEDI